MALASRLSLSLVFQLIAITALAVVVFGERPARCRWLGMAFGVVAVALIAMGGQA